MPTPTETLDSRLTRLETSAHRWKLATLSFLFLALAAFSLGQITLGGGTGGMNAPRITADQIIANHSITLNDSNGKPRILLFIENDSPTIQFKDADNHPLLTLSADQKSGEILIQDTTGKKLFSAP